MQIKKETLSERHDAVILVTRFDGSTFYINAELIRSIEHTPDTVITLSNEYKVIVHEPAEAVIERIIEYQRKVRGDGFLDYIHSMHKED